LLVDAQRRILAGAASCGAWVRRGSAHPPTLDRAGDTPAEDEAEGPAVRAGPSGVPTRATTRRGCPTEPTWFRPSGWTSSLP
jgi:hypothetical protein